MRTFYNGYCFSEEQTPCLYNPTLALYFLDHLQRRGRYPSHLLDENLAMDRGKLRYIAALPEGPELIEAALENSPPLKLETLMQRFSLEDILYGEKDEAFMLSLLYFFGVLTLAGRDELGRFLLTIPNLVTQQLYARCPQTFLPGVHWLRDASPAVELWFRKAGPYAVCALVDHLFS